MANCVQNNEGDLMLVSVQVIEVKAVEDIQLPIDEEPRCSEQFLPKKYLKLLFLYLDDSPILFLNDVGLQ